MQMMKSAVSVVVIWNILVIVPCSAFTIQSDLLKRLMEQGKEEKIKLPVETYPLEQIDLEDANLDPPADDPIFLRELLGSNLNTTYTSIDEPTRPSVPNKRRNASDLQLKFYKLFPKQQLPGGKEIELRLSKKNKNEVTSFFSALSDCRVQERWQKMPINYWPQYLNVGRCPDRTCSFPEGMKCMPDAHNDIKLLKWQCYDTKVSSKCQWLIINVPVLTQCTCGC